MKSKKNYRRLIDALEPRTHLDGKIELLPGVPFTQDQLSEFGVEVVTINGQKSYAFDGQFVLSMGGIHGGRGTQVRNAQAYLDSIPGLRELKKSFAGDVRIARQLGGEGQFLVKADKSMTYTQLQSAIGDTNKFRSIEPNSLIWAASRTPNDTNWSSQTSWMATQLQAPEAWDFNVGGTSDLVVAVIDSGIDFTHPDISSNMWRNTGEIPGNGIDDDNNTFIDDYFGFNFAGVRNGFVFDDSGHGTHVAGIIGAVGDNNRGVAGVNWNTRMMAVKVLNSSGAGSVADATDALNYVSGRLEGGLQVKVANISWELPAGNSAFQTAVTRYQTAGGLMVASAGNSGSTTLTYPAGYTNTNIISVANVTSSDTLFSTSNRGSSWVDLAAPGVNILSTLPANQYGTQTGTSQSAAFVSGAAALLWDAMGTDTPMADVRNAILNNVDVIGGLSGQVATSGRLNIFRAAQGVASSTGWHVTTTTPVIDGVVTMAPTDFTINFSAAVAGSSVQATDFVVNGIAADSFTNIDADTVRFTFNTSPSTSGGTQSMFISAGAIQRAFDGAGIDVFNGTFGFDNVPLIVSSTTPASGATVAVPVTSLDFTFNEPIDFSSVDPEDITLTQGSATWVEQISATTVRFHLDGVVDESSGSVNITMQSNLVNDSFGYGNTQFLMVLSLDNPPIEVPSFLPIGVPGGKAYRIPAPISGSINPSGDSDEYLVSLDGNQRLTVSVDPDSSLHPLIEVFDSTDLLLGRDAPDVAGLDALLQGLLITTGGQYRVKISSEQGTLGNYTMNMYLNTAEEGEHHNQNPNNNRANAQALDAAFTTEASGATRVAVAGRAAPTSSAVRVAAFSEQFAAPVLPVGWTTYSGSANGRVRVSNLFGGFLSPTALVMDRNPNGPYTLNEATWTVDLTGQGNPVLNFAHNDLGDEEHAMPSTYTSRVNGDGISISNNGVNWYRIWSPEDQPVGEWRTFSIDLAAAAQAAGISLGANTRIKFQQFDNQAAPADGRAYDAVSIVADALPEDWYSFVATTGQAISVALKGDTANSALRLDVFAPNGNLLTTAVTAAPWADQLVNSLIATASGTYTVRVYGDLPAEAPYTLNISKGAAMDVEPNTNAADSQDPGTSVVLGQIVSGGDSDRYRYNVRTGDVVTITTTTPGDGPNNFINSLDPAVELIGPTGSVVASASNGNADGRNVTMNYTATQNGVFTVRVYGESGTGEYVLRTTGPSGGALPFVVSAITPANNAYPTSTVSQITVDLSSAFVTSSVEAGDLKINGIGADTVSIIDHNTLVFNVNSPLVDGTYNLAINAGSITSLQNRPIDAFTSTFTVDRIPPKIIGTTISQGDFVGIGNLSFTAVFNEPMMVSNFDSSDWVLADLVNVGTTYTSSSFSWDANTNSLTINWTNIPETTLRLTLLSGNGHLEDMAGHDLDGEATWPLPPTGSGNTIPGGNFVLDFTAEAVTSAFGSLTRETPDGSLIYTGSRASKIDFTSDTDSYTISFEAGQVLSLELSGVPAYAPNLTLLDPSNGTVATATAAAGGTARIQTAALTTSGVYTIVVAADAGIGNYTLRAALNASMETSDSNDTIATAQDIAGSFIVPRFGFDRGAVVGTAEANSSDYFAFTLASGASLSALLAGASGLELRLYDSGNNLMFNVFPASAPIAAAVTNLASPGAGTYYARVTNPTGTAQPYRLMLARNSSFDLESNDTLLTSNEVGLFGTALGMVSTSSDVDFFEFNVGASDTLTISTLTPGDGAGLFDNTLDPVLDLYNPSGVIVATNDNGGPDGRNAALTYAATTAGIYTVRVSSAATTSGEYVLTVGGFSGGLLPLTVTSSVPADGAVLPTIPTTFTANFSSALLVSSVAADDLTINGQPATGFVFADADTVIFNMPAGLTNGTYTASIANGAVENLDGTGNETFTSTFTIDLIAPRIVATSIAQNDFLPIGQTLTFTATFDERMRDAQLTASDLILHGNTTNTDFAPTSVSYDTNTETFTATFDNLPEQRYRLTLISGDGAFEDVAGHNLDGEPTWPIPVNGTGNGTAGGNFFVDFDVETVVAPFTLPLTQIAPAGSQLYRGLQTGKIDFAGDTDTYLIDLDAGQTISLSMFGSTVRSAITLSDPNDVVIGSATSSVPGAYALVSHVTVATSGTYTIVATSPTSTSGNYTVDLLLNGDFELEERGGGSNNSAISAQNVNSSFDQIGTTSAERAAIFGNLGTSAVDRFAIYSDSFENLTFGPAWSFYESTTSGRTVRSTNYNPGTGTGQDGEAAMTMDVFPSPASLTLNEATWTVNLAGLNSPRLSFAHRNIGDELHTMPASFTGHANGDGVSISDDGVRWFTVTTTAAFTIGSSTIPALPSGNASPWAQWEINLVDAAAAAAATTTFGGSFNLNGTIYVKFQQYDNLSLPSDGRAWDNVQITVAGTSDFYSFSADAGDRISAAITGAGSGIMDLRIFDSNGNALITGDQFSGGDVDTLIDSFALPSAGTYSVRVAASLTSAENYGLFLMKNGTINAEPTPSNPQVLTAPYIAQGALTAGDEDVFSIDLTVNQQITVSTFTPGDGPDLFNNTLNPRIEILTSTGTLLFSDDNSAADGHNALLDFTAPSTGSYRIRVLAESGTGEYTLQVVDNGFRHYNGSLFGTTRIDSAPSPFRPIGDSITDDILIARIED